MCSPVLFSVFINDLASDIINTGHHGVSFSSIFVELFILLFADDIMLLSETVVEIYRLSLIIYAVLLQNFLLQNLKK